MRRRVSWLRSMESKAGKAKRNASMGVIPAQAGIQCRALALVRPLFNVIPAQAGLRSRTAEPLVGSLSVGREGDGGPRPTATTREGDALGETGCAGMTAAVRGCAAPSPKKTPPGSSRRGIKLP